MPNEINSYFAFFAWNITGGMIKSATAISPIKTAFHDSVKCQQIPPITINTIPNTIRIPKIRGIGISIPHKILLIKINIM